MIRSKTLTVNIVLASDQILQPQQTWLTPFEIVFLGAEGSTDTCLSLDALRLGTTTTSNPPKVIVPAVARERREFSLLVWEMGENQSSNTSLILWHLRCEEGVGIHWELLSLRLRVHFKR